MAVPFHFFDTIYQIIDDVGISKKVFSNMVKDIEKKFDINADSINLHHHANKFTENVLFIHDQNDEHCPYGDLIPIVTDSKSELYTTEGLLHRGSFRDKSGIEKLLSFLK